MPKAITTSNVRLASDIRVWREHDAGGINAIINHPEVRPWVEGTGDTKLDMTEAVANENNILLMGKHGAVFFVYVMPGTYECHTQILPEGRGKWAYRFGIAVLDWMFARSNAWEVVTRIPEGHLGALTLTRAMGFQQEFVSMEPCIFRGREVKASTWQLSIHDWTNRSQRFYDAGAMLHMQMDSEAVRLGIATPPHAPDAHHNAVAGAAIEMVRAGLVAKGLYFYNRWSALARHRPISMVSVSPPVIQMDIGRMAVLEQGIEITP